MKKLLPHRAASANKICVVNASQLTDIPSPPLSNEPLKELNNNILILCSHCTSTTQSTTFYKSGSLFIGKSF